MVLWIKARHLAGYTTIPAIHPLPLHSRSNAESARRKGTNLSVAICSFAIALRSSWLVAADMLVRGVAAVLPFVEPAGVEPVVEDASLSPLDLTFSIACSFQLFSSNTVYSLTGFCTAAVDDVRTTRCTEDLQGDSVSYSFINCNGVVKTGLTRTS